MSYPKATHRSWTTGDNTALMRAALSGQTSNVKTLLARGADVNACDPEGRTALMFAAINLRIETVNILLEFGADVNASDHDGSTPLTLAVCSGATDIAQLLLNRGADVDWKSTMSSRTALMIATERGYTKIIELLHRNSSQNQQPSL